MNKLKESLSDRAGRLKKKYQLKDFGFDSECIYQFGDLTDLLKSSLTKLLPEEKFEITETITSDNNRYCATINYKEQKLTEIFADTYADFLPDDFWESFDSIPAKMNSDKRFYTINPLLLGQEVWYFAGTENNLISAKNDGLPLVSYNDDFMQQDISEYNESEEEF